MPDLPENTTKEPIVPQNDLKSDTKQPEAGKQDDKQTDPRDTKIESLEGTVNQLTQTLNAFMNQNKRPAQQPNIPQMQVADYDTKQNQVDSDLDNGRITLSQHARMSRQIEDERNNAARMSMDSRYQQERAAAYDWLLNQKEFDEKSLEDEEIQQEVRRIVSQSPPPSRNPYAEAAAITMAINIVNQRRFIQKQGTDNLKDALNAARVNDIKNSQSVPSGVPAGGVPNVNGLSQEAMDAARRLGQDPNKVMENLKKMERR